MRKPVVHHNFKFSFWYRTWSIFVLIYVDLKENYQTALKSSVRKIGAPNRPSGVKTLKMYSRLVFVSPTRETLKHSEMLSGLDLLFVYVFHCLHFPILAVQLIKDTYFFYFLWLPRKPREIRSGIALRNPVDAKRAHKNDQVTPKWLNCMIVAVPSVRSWNR